MNIILTMRYIIIIHYNIMFGNYLGIRISTELCERSFKRITKGS